MDKSYDFKKSEENIAARSEDLSHPPPPSHTWIFSMYLTPPNASGPLHIGNALMIAIQDILARYHRTHGTRTIWVPGIDHGGYETQVTFEQEVEKTGLPAPQKRSEVYKQIAAFVERNTEIIKAQIRRLGASVDWPHFRYTMDPQALSLVDRTFRKMVADHLIYRGTYMINYCPVCATALADIELKEVPKEARLYHIRFPFAEGGDHLTLATPRPEFLYAVTHMLAHPQDPRLAPHIGRTLINPSTGVPIEIVESKRKFVPEDTQETLFVFNPSFRKYDFEYAIRHKLPTKNLLDWTGRMIERYPGLLPEEAREREVIYLQERGATEQVDEQCTGTAHLCKRQHEVETVIRMSWFLRLDDKRHSLRQLALDAMRRERLFIIPRWREKGLAEWVGKMHDWPLGRQNVWGIRIPLWYEVTDPALFMVWFLDAKGVPLHGNLKELLERGHTLEEISSGLERIYAAEGAIWTLDPDSKKVYLPETDTFDTWFSGALSSIGIDDGRSDYPYPRSITVIGSDLLRLSTARQIILGAYFRGKLPFKCVYLHALLKSSDGQKMSKSLGNAVTLDHYLETYGADVTRLALISYTTPPEDFYFSDERLQFFADFAKRLWTMGKISNAANLHGATTYERSRLASKDAELLSDVIALERSVGRNVEKYYLAAAQEKAVGFLARFETHAADMASRQEDVQDSMAAFHEAFKAYITVLHPFMPFMTEELSDVVYSPASVS